MKHIDDARARMIAYQKSVSAIFTEMQEEVRRKSRKTRGGIATHRKASYEGAAKEYLRRVSMQQIYC